MKVNVYADVVPFAASSWVAEQVVIGLVRKGHDVRTVALECEYRDAKPNAVFALTLGQPHIKALKVVVRPVVRLNEDLVKDAVVVTLWETDQLPVTHVAMLNLAKRVVVPCRWLAHVFVRSGVKRPVVVVPYGVAPEFSTTTQTFPKQTVFLAAGRSAHGRDRKGLDVVIGAFLLAFPNEKDVVLQVKTHDDCPLPEICSSRIQIITSWFDEKRMVQWYQQGLAFVSASRGEGWGLHCHEAMACGKPLISANFGGVTEFFSPPAGYVVKHHLVPSDMGGRWAELSINSLVEAMRFVYENPVHAFVIGLTAAKSVEHLTLEAMQSNHAKAILL